MTSFHNVLEQHHAARASAIDDAQHATEKKHKDSDSGTTHVIAHPVTPLTESSRTIPFTTSLTLRQDGASPETGHTEGPANGAKDTLADESSQSTETVVAESSVTIPFTSLSTFKKAADALKHSSTINKPADQHSHADDETPETNLGDRETQNTQKLAEQTVEAPATLVQTTLLVHAAVIHTNEQPQGVKGPDSGSPGALDSSDSASDSKNILPPAIELMDSSSGSKAGELAFAARLTPIQFQPPTSESARSAELARGSQGSLPDMPQVAVKELSTEADLPTDAHGGNGQGQSDKERASELFFKTETLLPQVHVPVANEAIVPPNDNAPARPLSAAAQMAHVIEPPTAAPRSNNDITVRIPDSTDQGTAVRFVERAGEIHVSVRTGDAEVAQSLRGGLHDLVNHLQDGGIRTEVWQPGSNPNSTYSQGDSHRSFADPDGSNGGNYSSSSNSEQESKQQNKPRWVEEMETSLGNRDFKEATKSLWQA